MFANISEASRAAGLSRTAAHHWYASGDARCLPSMRSVMLMADVQGLTDLQLGQVIRDMESVRDAMHVSRKRRKAAKTREENKRKDREKMDSRNRAARRRAEEYEMEKLAQEEREAELRAKEEFLSGEQDTGRLDRLIEIIERSI
tara:strand:+ start:686 stop:1120 length:435 start_codon:yes stop_codon:yes gene_type:complete